MKDNKIYTTVELNLDNVTLSISVRENLKKEKGNLKNFGCIKIHDGSLDTEEVFWDNICFFTDCCLVNSAGKEKFKKAF